MTDEQLHALAVKVLGGITQSAPDHTQQDPSNPELWAVWYLADGVGGLLDVEKNDLFADFNPALNSYPIRQR